MIIDFDAINNAKHIVITTDNSSFANASALYSYILTLHKKVSLYSSEVLENRLSFLPWYDKARIKMPTSADLDLVIDAESLKLYKQFITLEIKLNVKMATSLYAGILEEFDNFQSPHCNGIVFATASELIALKAEYKKCNQYLFKSLPLSSLRLKAKLLSSLSLEDNASHAKLYVSDLDLKSTGSSLKEAFIIMKEALYLVNVDRVTLYKSDENCKILKEI